MTEYDYSWHRENGVSPVVNVSGTMTSLGASIAAPGVADATSQALGHFVSMHEAQARASRVIARATGAKAGFLTASASGGITLCVAGCMTGLDLARAEALPGDTGTAFEVVVQAGHLCGYGAPIANAIELAGADVRVAGQSTLCADHQVEGAIGVQTAAALYVVSHHVVDYGQCPLPRFVEICHAKNIPVIVDAASEYDLRGFLGCGADLVVYSGHKFLGGPTSGIIAGTLERVRAAYLQNVGIGRGFKIGKESVFGAIAALEAWMDRDHKAMREKESAALEMWRKALDGIKGVAATRVADPTHNPLERLRVEVDERAAGWSAAQATTALANDNPAIIVRDHEIECGFFELDPCNLQPGQAQHVAERLKAVLGKGVPARHGAADARNGSFEAWLRWPK